MSEAESVPAKAERILQSQISQLKEFQPIVELETEKPSEIKELLDLEARLGTLQEKMQTRKTIVEQLLQKMDTLEEQDAELDKLEKRALELLIQRLERM